MTTAATNVHPVDEQLPVPRLAALGLQHVLVMYAGAVAVPLIVGRALKLAPEQVAMLISADLFCCGLVTLIQSARHDALVRHRLPVMMGVTFAAVGPMVAMAGANPGVAGAQALFGAIIGAGIVSMLIAPVHRAAAALLSAGGDRHHHRGDRHQPDARGHRLGDGRPGQPGAVHRRAASWCRWSIKPRPMRWPRPAPRRRWRRPRRLVKRRQRGAAGRRRRGGRHPCGGIAADPHAGPVAADQ